MHRVPNLTWLYHARIAELRKEKGFTQQQLAERVGVHAQQLKRYEAGASQPTLDVIRNLAMTLGVSSDIVVWQKEERGPDEALKLQFEVDEVLELPYAKDLWSDTDVVLGSAWTVNDPKMLATFTIRAAGALRNSSSRIFGSSSINGTPSRAQIFGCLLEHLLWGRPGRLALSGGSRS